MAQGVETARERVCVCVCMLRERGGEGGGGREREREREKPERSLSGLRNHYYLAWHKVSTEPHGFLLNHTADYKRDSSITRK